MKSMLMLLVAITTTLFCFLSATACLRFVSSRQGWFWVIPLVLSILFLGISIDPLHKIATGVVDGTYTVEISPDRNVREIVPLIIIILWYTMIITFRYALKLVVPENKHLVQTARNLNESRYLQRIELRNLERARRKREKLEVAVNREHSGTQYPRKWIARFDD